MGEGDLDLLQRINTPEMKRHLGGPESKEQVLDRHERYVRLADTGQGCMFRVMLLPECEKVGRLLGTGLAWRDGVRDGLGAPTTGA